MYSHKLRKVWESDGQNIFAKKWRKGLYKRKTGAQDLGQWWVGGDTFIFINL